MNNDRIMRHGTWGNGFSRRTFLKRSGTVGMATLGSAALLAACGGDTTQSSEIAPRGTKVSGPLTLLYMGTAEQQENWNKFFAEFRKQYPDVTLDAKGIASNNWAAFFDTVSTQIAGGQVPDLIQIATEGQRLFASRGLLEPIDAYLERDEEDLAEFFEDAHPIIDDWMKRGSSDENKYYLPPEFNTMGLWYNSELFQQAGIDDPADDWTWDDFLTVAEKITVPGKTFGMHAAPEYFAGIMPWLLTNGASTMNADWSESTVNTPAAIEAAEFMRSLVEKQISPPPGGTFDAFTATAQGKLAMFGGGRWPVISMRGLDAVDKVKVVPWPQKTQPGSPVGWNGYGISRQSQNKEAAWAFVKYTTTKEASAYFVREGGTIVPLRKSVAESDDYLSNAPAGIEKLYAALDYATPIPSPDKGNVIQKDIEDTWSQILAGNVPAAQALQELDQKIKGNLV